VLALLLKGVRNIVMRAAVSPPAAPFSAVRDNYMASEWHRVLSAHNEEWNRDESDKHRFALADRLSEASDAGVASLRGFRSRADVSAGSRQPLQFWPGVALDCAVRHSGTAAQSLPCGG
jgi:hypothetical protein